MQPLSLIQVLPDQPSITIECELTMGIQHPPIRVKSMLRPFLNIPDPPSGLTITLSYQTRSVSPGSDKDGEIYSVRYDAVNAISTNR
jgi:hypothetical protein